MKFAENLPLQLRLTQGALLAVFGLSLMAAVSTHQLLLDAANHPTSDFDLTSTHVVGTLDAARLPAAAVLFDSQGGLTLANAFSSDAGGVSTNGQGTLSVNILNAGGYQAENSPGTINAGGDVNLNGDIFVSGNLICDGNDLFAPADLFVAGYQIGDELGYLWTGNQAYVDGQVPTPTGFLSIKDATGTVYYIPVSASPQ